jgi:murein DD-endopeptidase MepM/ murein hydrolase activator NlpD
MPPHIVRFPLLALLGLGLSLPVPTGQANSAVYRWVDPDGHVHYGDHPQPGAEKFPVHEETIDPAAVADMEEVRSPQGSDIYIGNRLAGPLEISLGLSDAAGIQSLPALPIRQLLGPRQRVLVSRLLVGPGQSAAGQIDLSVVPGDPHAIPEDVVYSLPMDEDSGWQVGQGFHGGFSHTDEQNRYAVDLIVNEGTPILAARAGVVMQVESAFDRAGLDKKKYAERANLIRILHDDGTMGLYAHLKENGVYVRVGQRVNLGQQIAVSGNTGYSSGPHLHFCVQVNVGMRLVSLPFRMVSGRGFLPLPKR